MQKPFKCFIGVVLATNYWLSAVGVFEVRGHNAVDRVEGDCYSFPSIVVILTNF